VARRAREGLPNHLFFAGARTCLGAVGLRTQRVMPQEENTTYSGGSQVRRAIATYIWGHNADRQLQLKPSIHGDAFKSSQFSFFSLKEGGFQQRLDFLFSWFSNFFSTRLT